MSNEKSQFTGLILLSGVDTPGITQALFETLSPFAITVLDIEQAASLDDVTHTLTTLAEETALAGGVYRPSGVMKPSPTTDQT